MSRLNVLDFGAVPDGKTMNTEAIQSAIDSADVSGKTLYFPEGRFLSGSLNLKGASLYLERGCVLAASGNIADYPPIGFHHNEMGNVTSFLFSMEHENISISGQGTIELSGESFVNLSSPVIPPYYKTPLTEEQIKECNASFDNETRLKQPVFFEHVKNLRINGITILNSPCWTLGLSHCENVVISDIQIRNRRDITNNDGIHLSACRDVLITGCRIDTGDDCIALTGITDWESWCENVVISNCILSSSSKAILLGYMYSMVRNVTISNCQIRSSNWGICIICNDQVGAVKDVVIDGILIDTRVYAGNWWGNGEPLSIVCIRQDDGVDARVQSQRPDRSFPVSIENISVSHLICHGENAIGIVGSGNSVRGVSLDHIRFISKPSNNLALKGRTLDLNPAPYFAKVPENCFLRIIGVPDVSIDHVTGDPENGVDRIVQTEFSDCYLTRNRSPLD